MLKRILFFTVTMLMILSCEKKESVDFLTNGTYFKTGCGFDRN